jgi:hypothetical protein
MSRILLSRPLFWNEPRDPEAWLRALERLEGKTIGRPRAVFEHHLKGYLSRRSVVGLYGLDTTTKPNRLLGDGLLIQCKQTGQWEFSEAAQNLLVVRREKGIADALQNLALHLLGWSVWLRLMLLRIAEGQWQLREWPRLRAGNGQLLAGKHLDLGDRQDPETWTFDIERLCLGKWNRELPEESPLEIEIQAIAKSEDGFAWAPLKGPLYLLDSLGWLTTEGVLSLPTELAQDTDLAVLSAQGTTPAGILSQLTAVWADVRGFSPVEPLMRTFAERVGRDFRASGDFEQWMDVLLGAALKRGAIELHGAEPGQARHGRGLFGERERKLVRWSVHPELNALVRELEEGAGR